MKKSAFKILFVPILLLVVSASAWAQPTISSIAATGGGSWGGANSSYGSPWTITGTGFIFPFVQKSVRFVDVNNADIFIGIDCSSTTTCTASGVRPLRVAPGSSATIQVYALVNGMKSSSNVGFLYYGEPVISSVSPNNGPYNASTAFTANGGPFPTPGVGAAGLYIYSQITDAACATSATCTRSAPAISGDCCIPQGAKTIDIRTPGGYTTQYFKYRNASDTGGTPATPTITGISANTGPQAGGNTVTITGTNFITGGNSMYGGGFNVKVGTIFTFSTSGAFGTSNDATGVNCTSTTTCTMTVPSGGTGPVNIQVYTGCVPNAAPCGGANVRPSFSIPTIKSGLYAYPGIKVSTDNNTYNLNTAEGGYNAYYRVSLYSQPTADVTVAVSLSGGGAGELLSPPSLTFTPQNWAAPQTVTITGGTNAGAGNFGYSIRNIASSADLNYNGLERDTAVTNIDNGTKNFVVSPTSGLVTTRSGGTATFTVVLSAAPSSTVTMDFVSNDPKAGSVSPSSVTFLSSAGGGTGWNVPRTITVTGSSDGTPGKNRDYTIIMKASSSDTTYGNINALYQPDVQVTNIDTSLTPSGLSLTRSGATGVKVTWNPVDSADYYNIKYSTTPGGVKTTLASIGFPGQVLTGLTVGQQYYVVVSSVNAGGESANSGEVPFIMLPPGPVGAFGAVDAKSEMTYYTSGGAWKMLNSVGGYVSNSTVNLGGAGYQPVPGDYDGDQRQDVAVYNTTTGAWIILTSSSNFVSSINVSWGGTGYLPVPGDYDGDGKIDPAYYRQSTGQWGALLSSTNYAAAVYVSWGGIGYTPVPGYDVDGDFKADLTIYQQSTGMWYSLKSSTNYVSVFSKGWGGVGYTLVPGDYDGDKKLDLGLYQRSTGAWLILLSTTNYTTLLSQSWGGAGYLPVPGDYDGDGKLDLGVFEQATGNWYAILSTTNFTTSISATGWGTSADKIISPAIFVGGDDASRASDFEADGRADITVYQSATGNWATLTSSSNYVSGLYKSYGGPGYTAVPGDYDGDGKVDYGLYENSTGNWSILLSSSNFTVGLYKSAGGTGWIPVQGDYDGDGKTDPVVYNTTTGAWYGLKSSSNYTTTVAASYGGTGYTAVVGDFDGDGKTDVGYYQASTGNWSVLFSSTNYTTGIAKSVGGAGWIPVQADYDGDGKADFVVYNTTTGQWFGYKSGSNYATTINLSWGGTGYTPVKGDYDGDGKTDLATYVVSTGNWYILLSSTNYTTSLAKSLGGAGYTALPQYP